MNCKIGLELFLYQDMISKAQVEQKERALPSPLHAPFAG